MKNVVVEGIQRVMQLIIKYNPFYFMLNQNCESEKHLKIFYLIDY